MERLSSQPQPPQYYDDNDRTCRECRGPLKSLRQKRFCSPRHSLDYWSTRVWGSLRVVVFERDEYVCQSCGRIGYHVGHGPDGRFVRLGTVKVEADHIIELADGGEPWDVENVQTLCSECHKEKTADSRRVRAKVA